MRRRSSTPERDKLRRYLEREKQLGLIQFSVAGMRIDMVNLERLEGLSETLCAEINRMREAPTIPDPDLI